MGKFLHFISHSHWDREWYMSFEQHRFKLVEMIDKLIETIENDSDFKSFHLDGQIILIEDYLEIKPYMLEKIKKYIEEGRLIIGPWYVLQDEFLISGEANVRNLLYGLKLGKKYGPVCKIGYFPDAFGNISQAPQILNGFGIESAVFGRGVNPIGTNNTIIEAMKPEEYNSELIWKSPDGSEVLGIMFANWYNNACEIPTNKVEAKKYIEQIRDSAARYAATPHLLLMNGCDHQPVQVELSQILKSMEEEFSEDILIHSNFKNYICEVEKYRSNLKEVEGELTNQFTNGKYTLVNTASSRIYLKQLNHKAQTLLEKWVEPFGVFAMINGDKYRTEFVDKAWLYLLQNHPHDSICGCSIDDVHQEMEVRFKKSIAISEELINREIQWLVTKIDTSFIDKNDKAIIVFNPLNWDVTELVTTFVDFDCEENVIESEIHIENSKGELVAADISCIGRTFTYTLPSDSFRKVKYVNRFEITFNAVNISSLGYKTFIAKKSKKDIKSKLIYGEWFAENNFIRLDINTNGSLKVTVKGSGKVFDGLNVFENGGDIGDEYNFISPEEDVIINTQNSIPRVTFYKQGNAAVTFEIEYKMKLPISSDKVEGKRSSQLKEFCIKSYVTLAAEGKRIDISTEFDNNISDHRLIVLFPTRIASEYCFADGQFDITKRPIKTWEGWENPSNCQRQQAFIDIHDTAYGLTIANKGLPEYEILQNGTNTIALTLVRSIGELGDWGVFPTPGAQCPGKQKVEYSIIPYEESNRAAAYRLAYQFSSLPLRAEQTEKHHGDLEINKSLLEIHSKNINISAIKKCEENNNIIIRCYSINEEAENVEIRINNRFEGAFETNLNEKRLNELIIKDSIINVLIPSKKISTIQLVSI